MRLRYAYVDDKFTELDRISFSIDQAERFASSETFHVAILATVPLALEAISIQINRFVKDTGLRMPADLGSLELRSILSTLISKNNHFRDCSAEIRCHADLHVKGKASISIFLCEEAEFSTHRAGVECIVKRTVSNRNRSELSRYSSRMQNIVDCFLDADGFVSHASMDGVFIIQGDICYSLKQPSYYEVPPLQQIVSDAMKQSGLTVMPRKLKAGDFSAADEILFLNSRTVLEWCRAMGQKRFFSRKYRQVCAAIRNNESVSHMK